MRVRDEADLVDVELVDDEPPDDDAPSWAPVLRRPGWLRPMPAAPAWVWPTTAGTAAAALVAAVVVTGVAGAAEVSRLRGTEGLSGSLAHPLVEAWSAPFGGPMGLVGGVLLGYTGDGSSVVALDLGTGDELWSGTSHADGPGTQWCQLVVAPGGAWFSSGLEPREPDEGTLVCTSSTQLPGPAVGPEDVSVVRVLDPLTGELLRSFDVPGSAQMIERRGVDLVVYVVEPEGRFGLSRWSTSTGERLWAYSSEPGAAEEGYIPLRSSQGDVVLLDGPDGTAVGIDLATGTEVDVASATAIDLAGAPAVELPDGTTATLEERPPGPPATVVRGPDGQERFSVADAYPSPLTVDDGSVTDLLFMNDMTTGRVRALDPVEGDVRWTVPATSWSGLGVLDGTVLLTTDAGGMVAVAAEDGSTLWEAPGRPGYGAWFGGSVVTDGRRVLVTGPDPEDPTGPATVLSALDVRTGQVQWSVPETGAGGWLGVLPDGSLLATDGMTARLLRPGRP